MFRTIRIPALVAALLLTGCAQVPASPSDSPATATATASSTSGNVVDALVSNLWVAESIHGKELAADISITARFTGGGKISGSGGCNSYGATYSSDGRTLKFENVVIGATACDGDRGNSEDAYVAALQATRSFKMDGGRLVLQGDGNTALVSLSTQRQELSGTAWTVTSYNDGTGTQVAALDEPDATVSFGTDGKVAGMAGCNTFDGAFTSGGGTLKLGPLAATKNVCAAPEGLMAQETKVLANLEAAATFNITADELQLTSAAGAVVLILTQS